MPSIEDLVIAPGEDVLPMSLLMDDKCEELAHPHLFPTLSSLDTKFNGK